MSDDEKAELDRDRRKNIVAELRRQAKKARDEGRMDDNDIMHRAADIIEGPEWDGLA